MTRPTAKEADLPLFANESRNAARLRRSAADCPESEAANSSNDSNRHEERSRTMLGMTTRI